MEILVARWPAGVRRGKYRRSRAVHDDWLAARRLRQRDPALAVLHAAAQARARMEPAGDLGARHRDVLRAARRRDWTVDVLAFEALSQRRRRDEHSVSRPEAVAHGVRSAVRARGSHMGVQRHALDGSVSLAERRP